MKFMFSEFAIVSRFETYMFINYRAQVRVIRSIFDILKLTTGVMRL